MASVNDVGQGSDVVVAHLLSLLTVRIRHKRGALYMYLVVAYVPTELADVQAKDAFDDQLCAAVSAATTHDELYVLGDLNATTRSDVTLFQVMVSK